MSAPIKIAPKPTSGNVHFLPLIPSRGKINQYNKSQLTSVAQIPADGKIVLIQNSKGLQIPLKVVTQPKPSTTTAANNTTSNPSQNNIQVVKNIIVKTNSPASTQQETQKIVQVTSAPQTSPTKTKFIVKSGGVNQQIVLSTPSSSQPQKPEMKQSIVAPASSIMICSKGIQQTQPATNSQATTSSNYHAVNIPGKGVQIVRIVSPKTTVTSQTVPVVTKLTTIPSAGEVPKGNQVLIKGKDGQTLTVLQSSSSLKPPVKTYGETAVAKQPEVKEIKVEMVKKSPITTTTIQQKSDEPPAKKTKYITLTPAQINQIQGATIVQKDGEQKKIVMLPSNYMEQLEKIKAKSSNTTAATATTNSVPKTVSTVVKREAPEQSAVDVIDGTNNNDTDDPNKKKKRACNCTKSQCLKFYCDCFANGEFCSNCNCKDCLNLVDCVEREKAIKLCLERNPYAFK
jgi:hypothetical protein